MGSNGAPPPLVPGGRRDREDNRGLSIWDTFCHQPGRVQNGDTGDIACDHYHRYKRRHRLSWPHLGLQTYRFSVAWSRILPFGTGAVNENGLAFYDRVVDAPPREAGIQPALTLYHWDLPQALQDRGGWANRDIAGAFVEYAALMYKRYGDRVTRWITLNEPHVFTMMGHRQGVMAPGIRELAITARRCTTRCSPTAAQSRPSATAASRARSASPTANTSYEPPTTLAGNRSPPSSSPAISMHASSTAPSSAGLPGVGAQLLRPQRNAALPHPAR